MPERPDGPAQQLDDRYEGGWLCPTKPDRIRLTEMSPAVRRSRLLAGVFCGIGVIGMGPWIGWWPLAVFAAVPAPLVVLDRLLVRARRPERLVAASILFHTTLILVGIGITGGVRSPLLPWVAIPVVTAAARFRLPVFLIGAALTTAGLVAAAAISDPHALANNPAPLIAVVVLLGSLVASQQPVLTAELRWRNDAVLDPLTGLLNRQGLARRFREVAEQARMSNRPVSVALIDIDGFKHLNDQHGHASGDAALKDVAYALRKELRAFELLYRIGGDELLLILPGAEVGTAAQVAQQARAAIAACWAPDGSALAASIGVTGAWGDAIEFEPMYEMADQALYVAKRAGRDRVALIPDDAREAVIADPAPPVRQGSTSPLRMA
jgi:diguanylate cyclase (GGDEF)-like protein